jgi:hypothetical protein
MLTPLNLPLVNVDQAGFAKKFVIGVENFLIKFIR